MNVNQLIDIIDPLTIFDFLSKMLIFIMCLYIFYTGNKFEYIPFDYEKSQSNVQKRNVKIMI